MSIDAFTSQINFDDLLKGVSYKSVGQLNVRNRVDMHAIPRAYVKTASATPDFEQLFELTFGKFSVTVHNGSYMQSGKQGRDLTS